MLRTNPNVNHATSFYATVQSERDLLEFASSSHPRTRRGDVLANIPEEDESRTFEQDEKYLNDCLKGLNGNTDDLINAEESDYEVEEYDFDDYNSIASTVSLLNIATEDGNALDQRLPTQKGSTTLKQRAFSPVENSGKKDLHDVLRQKEIIRRQNGIAKVYQWDELGSSDEFAGNPQLKLLTGAERGDVLSMEKACQEAGASAKEFLLQTLDSRGNTALHKSAQFGKLSCLQWLVPQLPIGTVSIANREGNTATALAIQNGHLSCVQWLVEGAYVSDDVIRMSLLHKAASAGRDDILRYLLAHMKDKDISLEMSERNGFTPAHLAAREGHLLCLQTLVEHNIDVTVRDKGGLTPADYAHKNCQTGCYQYLVMVESCWLLAARVAKQHRQLNVLKDENMELRRRLELLEKQQPLGLPNRSEADGGDQFDSISNDSRSTDQSQKSQRVRFKDDAPDGQSPKHLTNESSFFNYQISENHGYNRRAVGNSPERDFLISTQTIENSNPYELARLIRSKTNVDSRGPGDSVTNLSLKEMLSDSPESEKSMAKQIASTTQRLLLSRHARSSDDSRRGALINSRREESRKPNRQEPVLKGIPANNKEMKLLLAPQYLACTEEQKLTVTVENQNERSSRGFPINQSSGSSKSNSPIVLSSSSRESSGSSSPVLPANVLRKKREPTIINYDSVNSGSSDSEHEQNLQQQSVQRNVQSGSGIKKYQFVNTVSPIVNSNKRYDDRRHDINDSSLLRKPKASERHMSASADDNPRDRSYYLKTGSSHSLNESTDSAVVVSERKNDLAEAKRIFDNQRYNEILHDQRQAAYPKNSSVINGFNFTSQSRGSKASSSHSEIIKPQRISHQNDSSTVTQTRTSSYLPNSKESYVLHARPPNTNILEQKKIHSSINNRKHVIQTLRDYGETETHQSDSSRKPTETDFKVSSQKSVSFFDDQAAQLSITDNSQTGDLPWYETDDWG